MKNSIKRAILCMGFFYASALLPMAKTTRGRTSPAVKVDPKALEKLKSPALKVMLQQTKDETTQKQLIAILNQRGDLVGFGASGVPDQATVVGSSDGQPQGPPRGHERESGEWVWHPKVPKGALGEWKWVQVGQAASVPPAGTRSTSVLATKEEMSAKATDSEREGALPGAPPPPPAPGMRAPVPPTKEKAEVKKAVGVERILPALSAEQIARLSIQEQKESDRVFTQAIAILARTVYVRDGQKISVRVGDGAPARVFQNAYEAYHYLIFELLTVQVGQNEAFKKRTELQALLDPEGSLQEFMKDVIQKPEPQNLDQFLLTLYEQFKKYGNKNDRYQTFFALLSSCLFDTKTFSETSTENNASILINSVVSQRPVVTDPTPVARVKSDDAVFVFIQEFMQQLQAEKVMEVGKLSHDYVYLLRDGINILRLNPEFVNFYKIGAGTNSNAVEERNVLSFGQMVRVPVLELLSTDQAYALNANVILGAIREQILFNRDALDDYVKASSLEFRTALDDHRVRIAHAKGAFDIFEFLSSRLAQPKSIQDLRSALQELKRSVGGRAEIGVLEAELDSFDLDIDRVFENLYVLAQRNVLPFEHALRTVLDAYKEEKRIAFTASQVLQDARKKYNQDKAPVGKFIVEELQQRIPNLPAKDARKLTALMRTPKTVRDVFVSLIGNAAAVEKIAKMVDFYAWIEPYGFLLQLIHDLPKESASLEVPMPFEKLRLFLNSIEALNSATMPLSPSNSMSAINKEPDLVKSDLYKEKLTTLNTLLHAYNVHGVLDEVEQLVVRAGTGVERTAEYQKLKKEFHAFLVKLFFDQILHELTALQEGQGRFTLPHMLLENRDRALNTRNNAIYNAMENMFGELIVLMGRSPQDFARTDEQKLDAVIGAIEEQIKNVLNAAHVDVQERIAPGRNETVHGTIAAYFKTLATRLKHIKNAAQAMSVSPVASVPSAPGVGAPVPPPPPPPPMPALKR
jgi:hypothetical protein